MCSQPEAMSIKIIRSCNNVLSKNIDSLLLQAIENYEDFNEQVSSTIVRNHFLTLSAEKTLNKYNRIPFLKEPRETPSIVFPSGMRG